MQVSVVCVDCAKSYSVDDSTIADALKNESIVVKKEEHPSWSYSQYHGICPDCQAIFRAASRKPKRRMTVEEESVAIQQRMHLLREQRPELTLEQAAHAAVEDLNDALSEPNQAFRKWLLEHER